MIYLGLGVDGTFRLGMALSARAVDAAKAGDGSGRAAHRGT